MPHITQLQYAEFQSLVTFSETVGKALAVDPENANQVDEHGRNTVLVVIACAMLNHCQRVRESESHPAGALENSHEAERCTDCGEPGERTGHMGCQYPQDH